MIRPFIVLALPRSRTFWLSSFLTYREWACGHDELRHVRSFTDIRSWFSQPCTGSCETAAAFYWRLIPEGVRIVIVRRPVEQSVDSMMRTMPPGVFDREMMTRYLTREDFKLAQVARRREALVVGFDDLKNEETCAKIFEYCLPYPHDHEWWRLLNGINLQINMLQFMRYTVAHRPQLDAVSAAAKRAILTGFATKKPKIDGIDFDLIDFETFLQEGRPLFAEHSMAVGESPTSFQEKNIPFLRAMDAHGSLQIAIARSNGRIFGYLMSVVGPSLEAPGRKAATQTAFFASKDIPGLGLKLERYALARAREAGVHEILLRAGTRGSGDRLGVLYRRLGAEKDGELYRLRF